ncbi:MAG: arsenate reductase (glutaredoxin) [Rickettsiales bacterium]|nr:arsenate reductase (glutaredoxin) [Rickettsiales bacterium]
MNNSLTIYHNPRCSKSRQTLALLESHGHRPEIILYLETPPSEAELKAIIKKLDIAPRALLRKGEEDYKTLGLASKTHSEAELIQLMVKHPKLIERPIVVHGNKAALGRPPEQVLDIL